MPLHTFVIPHPASVTTGADETDEDDERPPPRRQRRTSTRNPGKFTVLHRIAGAGLLLRLMELIDEDSVCVSSISMSIDYASYFS